MEVYDLGMEEFMDLIGDIRLFFEQLGFYESGFYGTMIADILGVFIGSLIAIFPFLIALLVARLIIMAGHDI